MAKKRILLVDDTEDVQHGLKSLLKAHNSYEVVADVGMADVAV